MEYEQLQEAVTELLQRHRAFDRLMADFDSEIQEAERLREALRKCDSEAQELYEALQDLLDVQNGPPLPGRYAKEWKAAVDQARAVLGEDK